MSPLIHLDRGGCDCCEMSTIVTKCATDTAG